MHYDYCDSLHPCHIENTLLCEGLTVGYKCHCKAGWGGHDCSLNLDNCASNPCSTRGELSIIVVGGLCLNADDDMKFDETVYQRVIP